MYCSLVYFSLKIKRMRVPPFKDPYFFSIENMPHFYQILNVNMYRPGISFGAISVTEPPICISITRELVTCMTSEAYVYIVDTVDSSPYKAMSRQLSVNVSILYVIKHLQNITVFPKSIFYTPNFLIKVPTVAAVSHSNVVYPFVVCPLNTFQVWKWGTTLNKQKIYGKP